MFDDLTPPAILFELQSGFFVLFSTAGWSRFLAALHDNCLSVR